MNFDDFTFENIAFEVRYKQGFLYWDNFGKLWKGLTDKWPSLVCMKVGPESAHLRLKDEFVDITFGPDKSLISQYTPKETDVFCEIADESIGLINRFLEIDTFTRVGNRIVLVKPFDKNEAAAKALTETPLFSLHSDKTKYLGKTLKEIELRLTQHDEDVGCSLRLRSTERELTKIDFPFPVEIDTSWFHKSGIIVDVDYFSTKAVDFGILKSSELIKANLRKAKLLVRSL